MKKTASPLFFKLAGGLFLFGLLFSFKVFSEAPGKFWVSFTDKHYSVFDPFTYFDERTILQRQNQNIPIVDSTDFPVSPQYLDLIASTGATLSWPSRWLNGVALFATDQQILQIKAFAFVKEVEPMVFCASPSLKNSKKEKVAEMIPLLHYQTERMKGEIFRQHHMDGSGIRIAVLDAGFPGVDKNPVFKKLRDEKRIVATYDFVSKKEFVFAHHWHGAATLSCMAGIADSIPLGLATGAEYLLARTERILWEPRAEEEYWLAAAEWADQHGANIISSSLGYTNGRYFTSDMDGRKSLVARAANMAAKKGILVVNAAGNEGQNEWHTIDTPADADSVLSVGGTNPESDMHIYFSSFGPNSAGVLKPNVCAVGKAVIADAHKIKVAFGTSFSTPLVAGFAACAWQSHRTWNNMELFKEMEKSGHLFPYFDYAHGYGIPQASYFFDSNKTIDPTFDFVVANNEIKVVLREQFSYAETERSLGYAVRRNLYYKVENQNGNMISYSVLLAENKEVLHFYAEDFHTGDVITVHFEGYTGTLDFPKIELQDDSIQK